MRRSAATRRKKNSQIPLKVLKDYKKRGDGYVKTGYLNVLKKTGKTQAWLSAATGINAALVSQLCSGRSLPTPGELSLICGTLGCRREELYDPIALQLITGAAPKPKKKRETDNVRIKRQMTKRVDRFAKEEGLSRDAAAGVLILMGWWCVVLNQRPEPPAGAKEIMIPPILRAKIDNGGEQSCHGHA